MEVMEEGNLMDRIPILLQRDMEYYEVCVVLIFRNFSISSFGIKRHFWIFPKSFKIYDVNIDFFKKFRDF